MTPEYKKALAIESQAFPAAFGCFMMAWVDAEMELYRTLVHYCGVTDAVARAIFSGARYKPMAQFLRAINNNAPIGQDRMSDLDFVLCQLVTIGGERDHIVHYSSASEYGLEPDDPSARLISDSARVSRLENYFVKKISSSMLEAMTTDLENIAMHLRQHWMYEPESFQALPQAYGAQTTWRYKPSVPKTQGLQNSRSAQKRERPPKSSRGKQQE